jgi:hypothetical protein
MSARYLGPVRWGPLGHQFLSHSVIQQTFLVYLLYTKRTQPGPCYVLCAPTIWNPVSKRGQNIAATPRALILSLTPQTSHPQVTGPPSLTALSYSG